MQVRTTRFGSVSFEESQIVTFAGGLPGFESARRFVFLPHPGSVSSGTGSPFQWLQCVDDAPGADALAMPVIDPWLIDPNYTPTIPNQALQELGLEQMQGNAQCWAVVTVPHDQPEQATVNLLAPLLINRATCQAQQVALHSDKYQLRTPLKAAQPQEKRFRPMPAQERPLAVAVG